MIECDAMGSFVGPKGNQQGIWLALDTATRESVGVHVGKRRPCRGRGALAEPAGGLPAVCGKLHGLARRAMRRCFRRLVIGP